ncbi:hypothetical protein [uncultured Sphingomonas sp.]|uniref:hypothetical protein n=1 Tax=uncultured Sphingomonas sp. TaxID=158754 RepID=UPI0035CC5951
MKPLFWRGVTGFGLAIAAVTGASAQRAPDQASGKDAAADPFAGATAVAESDLDHVTGRENIGTQIASATQRNTVSNNSVVGTSVTGAVSIDGNAFQNLQGLAVINANSGNNVAINSAMNVTINLGPQ